MEKITSYRAFGECDDDGDDSGAGRAYRRHQSSCTVVLALISRGGADYWYLYWRRDREVQ